MAGVFKGPDEAHMPGVLKGLQGKSMTKKKLFDFLADINLEELCAKKDTALTPQKPVESAVPSNSVESMEPIIPQEPVKTIIPADFTLELIPISDEKPGSKEIRCQACMKTFTANSSLKRHLDRSKVCADWIEMPQKADIVPLTRGIHLIIDELLDKAISGEDLQCKFCEAKFINKGNHHKHFNYASVCNRLAYQEFKKIFLAM